MDPDLGCAKPHTNIVVLPVWLIREILLSHTCGMLVSRDGTPVCKSANVVPLPKITPPSRVDKDLHPISLTPVLCKGLEFHVRDWMIEIIKDNIDPNQFGSLPGCSITQALVNLFICGLQALKI